MDHHSVTSLDVHQKLALLIKICDQIKEDLNKRSIQRRSIERTRCCIFKKWKTLKSSGGNIKIFSGRIILFKFQNLIEYFKM